MCGIQNGFIVICSFHLGHVVLQVWSSDLVYTFLHYMHLESMKYMIFEEIKLASKLQTLD